MRPRGVWVAWVGGLAALIGCSKSEPAAGPPAASSQPQSGDVKPSAQPPKPALKGEPVAAGSESGAAHRETASMGAPIGSAVPVAAPAPKGEPAVPMTLPPGTDPFGFAKHVQPFLAKHCFACHKTGGKKSGGVALDIYTEAVAVVKNRKVWDKVLANIRSGDMPPPGKPRPASSELEAVKGWLESTLTTVDCTQAHNPGRPTVRRLNRAEYNNTVRDLTGVNFAPADDFPADDVGYGFDNIGDVLSVSPILLERYLAAAERIAEKAVVIPTPAQPTLHRFGGGNLRITPKNAGTQAPRGPQVITGKGEIAAQNYFDAGEYTIKVRAFGKQAGADPVKMAIRLDRNEIKTFEVKAEEGKPAVFEVKTTLKTGTARVSAAFLNDFNDTKEKKVRALGVASIELDGPYNAPPPEIPEAQKKLLAHKAGIANREAAREILTRFAARAFRRPATSDEVDRLLKLYDMGEKEGGGSLEAGIRVALQGVLCSPHFLFRVEADKPGAAPGTVFPVNEFELATRLSYFLWSTMPDDELTALAAAGNLRKELDAQVRRMLKDPRSAALTENFAGQWLQIRNLKHVAPDRKLFPAFDEDLRSAMYRETELFFDAVMREDRSVLEFIDSDYTFVNERLARHYGIAGVKGKDFRKVSVPAGQRGGVLTQASILTITSNPTRTSPVKRGKWILEQILGTPPPPPPPDVPELENNKAALTGSLRQRMEKHRENPTCASCHNRMDPIGFGFENFDAVGAWRTADGKFPIEPGGELPGGKTFQGPADLKSILKGRTDLFGRNMAEKVLTYALGRGLEPYDKCEVDAILAAMKRSDFRFSGLITAVVKSEPFQKRRAKGGKDD